MTSPTRYVHPMTVAALLDQPTMTIDLEQLIEVDDMLRGLIDLRVPFAVLPSRADAVRPGYTVYVPDPLPPLISLGQLWGFVRAGISQREEEDRKDREAHIRLELSHA